MDEKHKTLITESIRLTISDLDQRYVDISEEIQLSHPEVFSEVEGKILSSSFSEWLQETVDEFAKRTTVDIDRFIDVIVFNFAYLHTNESPYEAVSMNQGDQKMIQSFLKDQSNRTLELLTDLEGLENKSGVRLSNSTRTNSRIDPSYLIDELKDFHDSLQDAMKVAPLKGKQGNFPHGSTYFIVQTDLFLSNYVQLKKDKPLNGNQRANILSKICRKLGHPKSQGNIIQILRNNKNSR